ncbi:hypothetical protein RCJ22_06625 [Vibrio sp. FNV 38]|nr:hypothetical protein [Vibrio sp. FNV 38]
MKVLRISATLAAFFLLQACSHTSTALPETQESPFIVASLDNPETIQAQPFIVRGEVVVGHEVRTIKPCGSQQQYWLNLPSELVEQAIFLTQAPYQPLYGEVVGYLIPSSRHGFDSDYNAVFQVESVNILSAENPQRCDQALKSTQAFGNEPHWSVRFEQQGLQLDVLGQQSEQYQLEGSTVTKQDRTYRLSDGARLSMHKATCNDGMSDSIYGWEALFNHQQKRFSGCATLSNQDHSDSWIGRYHAESTDNPLFNVHLSLNSDHSAVTTYAYLNGQPSTVERGFWQQLNQNQIQVTMTRHQQQYLVSERIFTRDGDQITTKKEKVSDIVYPIADGGLSLFKANKSPINAESNNMNPSTAPIADSEQVSGVILFADGTYPTQQGVVM